MARVEKFSKENFLEKGVMFIKEKGIWTLNARDLCKFIGCSTQPLFRHYKSMEDFKIDLKGYLRRNYELFIHKYIREDDYLFTISTAYAFYALKFSNLFFAMFLSEFPGKRTIREVLDTKRNQPTIEAMTKTYHISISEAEELYRDVRFYTHGLASQICNGSIVVTEDEIVSLIRNVIQKLLKGGE